MSMHNSKYRFSQIFFNARDYLISFSIYGNFRYLNYSNTNIILATYVIDT